MAVHIAARAVLVLLALLAAHVQPSSSSGLPDEMHSWNRIPGFANATRIWDRSMLDRAIVHMGSLARAQHLFDKLSSGKRIVALAVGSSFVHDFAGCWQPSIEALWQLGVTPNPMLYPQQGAHISLEKWDYVRQKCASGGYMEAVMETLNATYPNPHHIFLNNGKGGACLQLIAQATCMSAYTPTHVDLVLLDTVTNVCDAEAAEKVVRQFVDSPGQPLVLLVSNARNCQQLDATESARCAECLRKHWGNTTPECQGLSEPYTPENVTAWMNVIRPYQDLAVHYDLPHLNLEVLMQYLVTGSGLAEAAHTSRLQLLARFYQDWVHFRKEDLGTLLVADVLMHYLRSAQSALQQLPAAERTALSYTLPAPRHASAVEVVHTRCYGMSMQQVMRAAEGGAADAAAVAQLRENARPGDFFSYHHNSDDNTPHGSSVFHTLPPLRILNASGWELQLYYKGQGGATKFKPGWRTKLPGAVLEFEVDSHWQEAGMAGAEPEVVITYTASYGTWGRARVFCVSGCSCEESVVDAAMESKVSLARLHSMRVSQHAACRMRVEMLQESTSGGHHFKVSQVVVRAKQRPAANAHQRKRRRRQ